MGVRDASEPRSKEHADFKANPSKREKRERGVICKNDILEQFDLQGTSRIG